MYLDAKMFPTIDLIFGKVCDWEDYSPTGEVFSATTAE
jgi:hypothetical protein